MRTAHTILLAAAAVVVSLGTVGCEAQPQADGERPGVVVPARGGGENGHGNDRTAAGGNDRVIAEIDGVKVLESQVLPALYESYGLDIVLKFVQLNMSKAEAATRGITVSPSDVQAERDLTLQLAFPEQKPEDYDQLLTQLLAQQRVSRAEFAIVMETNAYLRALVRDRAGADVTEELVREEFNAVYGERVRVRHIALGNLQEVVEARRRLVEEKQPFEQVAREMSQNPNTARTGGELPPFARTSAGYSEVFVQAAFALKPGEISTDAIQDRNFYHIIKVEDRIAPKAVKYDDHREAVREALIRRRQNALMGVLRGEMAQRALRSLTINEPAIKKEFAARLEAANPKADREDVRRRLDARRDRLNQPATSPTTEPAPQPEPAAVPATAPAAPEPAPTTTTAP